MGVAGLYEFNEDKNNEDQRKGSVEKNKDGFDEKSNLSAASITLHCYFELGTESNKFRDPSYPSDRVAFQPKNIQRIWLVASRDAQRPCGSCAFADEIREGLCRG